MDDSHELVQISKVNEVLDLVQHSDMKLKKAMAFVGISPTTYYKWFAMANQARELLHEAKQRLELIEYADIVSSQGQILRKLVDDALDDNTFPSDRLAIFQYLSARVGALEAKHRPSDAGADFLLGPSLTPGTSTYRDTTIQVAGVTIQVTEHPPETIEGEIRDPG